MHASSDLLAIVFTDLEVTFVVWSDINSGAPGPVHGQVWATCIQSPIPRALYVRRNCTACHAGDVLTAVRRNGASYENLVSMGLNRILS